MFLNVRDILPAQIPLAASLLDTLDVLLAVAFPSSWLSGDLVNQLLKIFLGHALEESIKVGDNSKANDEIALPSSGFDDGECYTNGCFNFTRSKEQGPS